MFHSRTEPTTDDPRSAQRRAIYALWIVIPTLAIPLAYAMKSFLAGHH